MDRIRIQDFLARAPSLRILVIGDLMLDEYVWGRSERISPEAPVQVVDVVRAERRLGGAGNVLNNLSALGCQVAVAGVVGDDPDGRELRRLLREQGVGTDALLLAGSRITSRKTRVLASNQQVLRIDRESREPIDPVLAARLADRLEEVGEGYQLLLVSDYLKGVLTEELLSRVIAYGRRRGIPVLVDPKGEDFSKYRGATLLTPNRKEAQVAAGTRFTDEPSLRLGGRSLRERLDLEALVLTRSEEGMTLFFRDGRQEHLSTMSREVFDVTGAGDTVLSFLGAGMAAGFPLAEAARLANLAAGIVVGKVGTSTVLPAELLAAAVQCFQGGDRKIQGRDALAQLLARERAHGRRVVFTNGCFDLLHVGHIKYLQKARQLGDLLVLGLNSDASIRRLKGPQRPLIGEEERSHMLAALECIDHIVIFEEDTPLELIRSLRPDILVKGGDYAPGEVVGKEVVESYGGRVEIIQFVDGKSTTGLINRILEQYREL